jgi:DNA repair protein RecN (Recombination protein N)
MLSRLEIENYGLIARAAIDFSPGATIFTGETGSGKTMILGAIAFVLGARASADIVRGGASRTRVTLTFEPSPRLRERFAADGFEVDAGEEASFVREMNDAGKSSVRVNGAVATAAYVREIAESLAEIVGQHDAQRLLAPAFHVEMLDRFAGPEVMELRAALAAVHERVRAAQATLREYTSDERKAQQHYDDAKLALQDIEAAIPLAGEDDRLSERRRYLDNVERIAAALRTAHEALAGEESGATSALGSAAVSLRSIADISDDLSAMAVQATALQSEAGDLATSLARELDATEFDPAELEAINVRLDHLERLKRKYGGSIDAVLARLAQARDTVEGFETRDERAAALAASVRAAQATLANAAGQLHDARVAAANRLKQSVTAELADLALASARFDVAFEPLEEIGPSGGDAIEFTFAANAGEPLRPLARVASGGELSRVLLALVVALAGTRERTALIFDEIDAGIGGATATAVGARIGRLAREGQVVCVTHLAQLATWSDRHYVLGKTERDGVTTIGVTEISGEEARAGELARMLSGESHDVALEHARMLLRVR